MDNAANAITSNRSSGVHRPPWERAGTGLFRVATGVVFVFLFIGAVLFGMTVFPPESYQEAPQANLDYPLDAMQDAVDWRNVKTIQDDIVSLGSRFMGQAGVYATEDYIRRAFEAAGLEIHEQENWTVIPKTEFREIYLAEEPDTGAESGSRFGRPLKDAEIYPFMPNHLQPVTTPDDGIVGELVALTRETIHSRVSFDGCIGVIDTSEDKVPDEYGYDWTRYAQLGIEGLIVSHPEGLDRVPWHRVAAERDGMVSSVPVNFLRVAAEKGIFQYLGRRVRIRVRVRFEEASNTTLAGILRAGDTSREKSNRSAIFLLSSYDACSILPDRAPGVAQALWPATQLALVQGLAPYRKSLVRDVVFVAFGAQVMARDGENNLLRLLDENIIRKELNPFKRAFRFEGNSSEEDGGARHKAHQKARLRPWLERREANAMRLATIEQILGLFEDEAFLRDLGATQAGLDTLDRPSRKFFGEQVNYALNTIVFGLSESQLRAKLAFMRDKSQDLASAAFSAYFKEKNACDRMAAIASYSIGSLLGGSSGTIGLLAHHNFRQRCKERFEALYVYHARKERGYAKDIALLEALNPYQDLIIFDTCFMPAVENDRREEVLSFSNGHWAVNAQMRTMVSLMASARQRLRDRPGNESIDAELQIPRLAKLHHNDVSLNTRPLPDRSINLWTQFGYLAFKMLSFGRPDSYLHFSDPVDLPYMHNVESLRHTLAVTGETILSVAHGNGQFPPIQVGWLKKQFGGRVLASGIGQAIAPHYGLQKAVLASRPFFGDEYAKPGFYDHLLIMSDVYGRYEIVNCATDFWVDHYIWANGYSPVAAWHGADGRIAWMKDEGEDGQRLYKSVNLNWFEGDVSDVTLVAFRAAPVAFLDMTNAQTMKDYAGVKLISREGLSPFRKQCVFNANGVFVYYIEPDQCFYATFESGTADNELAKVVRAFLLGDPESDVRGTGGVHRREVDGAGYLAAVSPIIERMPQEIARSMVRLNGKRLALQNRHGMADVQTNDYHQKSVELLRESEEPDKTHHVSTLESREAVVYATLNHPVLRKSVIEAVIGILWYTGLLVPFVYFFEKLLFCYSDVRKQIAVQTVVFLVVFALLRFMHPAFEMVRSSLMILLGFLVILISGGMSILFSGKFKENLEDLRKKRGQVDAAEVDRLAAIGSAFMLGLNNMHRRKIRTWLTCGTLTLITFALICFTSVQSDIAEEITSIGKAPYQGLLIKRENFRRFTEAELFAIRTRFEDTHQVCLRKMYLGIQNWEDRRGHNPELEIVYESDGLPRSVSFSSILQFSFADPLQEQIRMLTNTTWFSEQEEKAREGICPVLIPDTMADRLGISINAINTAPLLVRINNRIFAVRGIFDAKSLDNVRDLDVVSILPYDIESMAHIQQVDEEVIADDDDPRILGRNVILAPLRALEVQIPNSKEATVSVALAMPGKSYREVKDTVASYLEQSGKPAYFGIEGVAYRGKRTRERTVAGIIDLLIPLLIAGLTVLNTMRGSVYERRDEIEVYNAVGIAPRYIFFIFFAEAFVYAVVGCVLGYLLSQGTGRVLTALEMTGGMNMTFTSISTIYASLAVVAAVIISTYFPARSAMNIAKPAEDAGWTIPIPEGDRIVFDLPFTFSYRDRMAVVTFFERFLLDHGEGGAGRFSADEPVVGVVRLSGRAGGPELVPQLRAGIWLKPFDFGVSQALELEMPVDEETGEFKASLSLERLTGTRSAWLRLNHSFVAEVRRHFLHWRAVTAHDREAMFEETRRRMAAALGMEPV